MDAGPAIAMAIGLSTIWVLMISGIVATWVVGQPDK